MKFRGVRCSDLMMMLRLLAVAVVGGLSVASCAGQEPPPLPPPPIHRGLNILGSDPIWMNPAAGRFRPEYFATIKSAGFDFVRVAAGAMRYMDASDQIDPRYLQRMDWVVANARAAGLSVIIDEHDFQFCASNAVLCRRKLLAFWRQVSVRYRREPSTVLFEILNEPKWQMDPVWNDTIADVLKVIRATNPDRTVVIGPRMANKIQTLDDLRLPDDDRHILVTFHYYEPHSFSHQGAPWDPQWKSVHGQTWGSPGDRATLAADFDRMAAWARRERRPVLLGEFGAYDGSGTPIAQRGNYVDAIAREAEKHGFAWCYWQFDGDFIAYDVQRNAWVGPILNALIPGGTSAQPAEKAPAKRVVRGSSQ